MYADIHASRSQCVNGEYILSLDRAATIIGKQNIYTRAIRNVTSGELLAKQAMRRKIQGYSKRMNRFYYAIFY